MFRNLEAEMARHNPKITRHQIAACLGVTEKTMRGYLKGTVKISWFAVLKIKYTFFPKLSVDYLFSTDDSQQQAG